jgi:hypothetical protein
MKISESLSMSQIPHAVNEQYASREMLKTFSAVHHNDASAVVRSSNISDVVSLTAQAKLSSKQTPSLAGVNSALTATSTSSKLSDSPVSTNSVNGSSTDYEAKGGEAVVQLIEMLTGIKVKLLTQADLLAEDKKRQAEAAKIAEQQGATAATTGAQSSSNAGSIAATNGVLKFSDGKEMSFSLDMALPVDKVSSVESNQNVGGGASDGVEIYLQKTRRESTPQENVLSKRGKGASEREVKQFEKLSGSVDTTPKTVERSVKTAAVASSESVHNSRVIGRLTFDSGSGKTTDRYVVPA